MMIAKYLWLTGSVIVTALGVIHLYFTFFTNAFSSGNQKMVDEMKSSSPMLSQDINMWKAWIGFNASHSSGLLFIGIINLYLAFRYFNVVQAGHFFFLLTILTVGFYVWLAATYWFMIPCIGVSIAFGCFLVSYALTLLTN